MKLIIKAKELRDSIKELKKLNEDLLEKNLANKNKIESLEKKVSYLKNNISESILELEEFMKKYNANT